MKRDGLSRDDLPLYQDQQQMAFEKNVHLAATSTSVGNSVTTDAAKRKEESRPKDCAHTELPTIQVGLVANVLLVVVSEFLGIQRHVSYAPQILLQIIYYQTFLGSAQKKE